MEDSAAVMAISMDEAIVLFKAAINGARATGTDEEKDMVVGIVGKFASALGVPLPDNISLPDRGSNMSKIVRTLYIATDALVHEVETVTEGMMEGRVRDRFEEIAGEYRSVRARLASMVTAFAGDVQHTI